VRRGINPDVLFWSFLPLHRNKSNKFLFWNVETGVYLIIFRIKLSSLPLDTILYWGKEKNTERPQNNLLIG